MPNPPPRTGNGQALAAAGRADGAPTRRGRPGQAIIWENFSAILAPRARRGGPYKGCENPGGGRRPVPGKQAKEAADKR
ncbi:MAG: hypothetical protein OXU61_09295 [Gammaproteobacteria bacterium]|nr:hypothetical protein [Gammaproteobacteria bacterium]